VAAAIFKTAVPRTFARTLPEAPYGVYFVKDNIFTFCGKYGLSVAPEWANLERRSGFSGLDFGFEGFIFSGGVGVSRSFSKVVGCSSRPHLSLRA
jgi:hypothetical protein